MNTDNAPNAPSALAFDSSSVDAPPVRSGLVPVGDVGLFVQERGDGAPVLMIAGLGYASWCWEEVMARLSTRWRTIAFDNRGAGRSDKPPGPYSIEMFADDAAAVLTGLGVPSAHVIGNSMGGYIALTMAARHPEKVRSLILTGTSHGGPGAVPVPAATSDAWREASALGPREFAERTMAFAYPPGWAETNASRFRAILERRLAFPTPQVCWSAQLAACERFAQHGVDAGAIEQPALVLHGTQDRILPYENGVRLSVALKRGELRTQEGVGHLPFLECPEEFASIADEFLRAQEQALA